MSNIARWTCGLTALLVAVTSGGARLDAAATAGTVGGHGTKDGWTVKGTIRLGADGAADGRFEMSRKVKRGPETSCRFDVFQKAMILVNQARFEARGVCTEERDGRAISVVARNHFTIVDNGEGNRGSADSIAVRALGERGVDVPAGPIDNGNFQVRAPQRPNLDELQLAAIRTLRSNSTVPPQLRLDRGFPRSVMTRLQVPGADAVSRARSFLDRYKHLYRLDNPDLGLGVRRRLRGPDNAFDVVTFYQTVKGLRVHGADIVVWLKGSTLYGTVGHLVTQDARLDAMPWLAAREAEDIARGLLDDRSGVVAGVTSLMAFNQRTSRSGGAELHLAWRVTLGEGDMHRVFVDAHNGAVLDATALSHYDYDLDLQSAENDADGQESNCFWWSDDTTAGDEGGLEDAFENDTDANNALNFSKSTYNFFLDKFGRDSYDNDANEIEIYIHSTLQNNARYLVCEIGDELFEFANGFVVDDVMTHEFTHGVIDYGSDLISGRFPGAINESLSDTMALVHTGDPLMGEDLSIGPRRNIGNPSAPPFLDPDRMSEVDQNVLNAPMCLSKSTPQMQQNDNCGVHSNNGVTNIAGFLLGNGGTHPDTGVTVSPVGMPVMGYLAYLAALTIPADADPFDVRDSEMVWAALSNYSYAVICSIKNAFGAAEVGDTDVDCNGNDEAPGDPDDDSVPNDGTDNCPGIANPGQANLDNDDFGDACDDDDDGDGVPEKTANNPFGDNCPGVFNPDQKDLNFNQIGAACDPLEDGDIDDDHVADEDDNCPLDWNPKGRNGLQLDSDNDGEGDACDPDADADGISNDNDNCTSIPNADQADADDDGAGDACDKCPEDSDSQVAFGYFTDPISGKVTVHVVVPDSDHDGIPDACDGPARGQATIAIDGAPYRAANGPKADGQSRSIHITGAPRSNVSVPLSICNGECPVAPAADSCVALEFNGIGRDVLATVTDDAGHGVGSTSTQRNRVSAPVLRIQPRGASRYFLNFALSPHFSGDAVFNLVETACAVGDRSGRGAALPLPPPEQGRR